MAVVPCKISRKTPGAILQPQPPPCESDVKRGEVSVVGFVIGRHYKRDTHSSAPLNNSEHAGVAAQIDQAARQH